MKMAYPQKIFGSHYGICMEFATVAKEGYTLLPRKQRLMQNIM
jgi:hypothetical protein